MKVRIVTAIVVCFIGITFSKAQIPPIPDPYLFAHWKFDSILDDFTYNANHLAHGNGTWHPVQYTIGHDSLPNTAVQLNAYALRVISYQNNQNPKLLQIDTGYNTWSVAAWVRGSGVILANHNQEALDDSIVLANTGQFSISVTTDKKLAVSFVDVNSNLFLVTTDTLPIYQRWNHFVIVFNKEKDSLIIYHDAQKIFSAPLIPMKQESAIMCIGGRYFYNNYSNGNATWGYKNKFFGRIDDIKIYKKEVTEDDVLQLYVHGYISGLQLTPQSDLALSVYPNPTTESFAIESPYSILNISLYSVSGERVLNKKVNKEKLLLSINNFEAGIYYLAAETSQGLIVKKIIKQ
jgi:hypothetical protein